MPLTDTFVSYNSADFPHAREVARALHEAGLSVWFDKKRIQPGDQWAHSLNDGIDGTRSLVLVYSAHTNDSPHVGAEVMDVFSARKPIVWVKLEDAPVLNPTLRRSLNLTQWIEAYTRPLSQFTPQIVEAVRRAISRAPSPVHAEADRGAALLTRTETAVQALLTGDFSGARDLLTRILEDSPHDPLARLTYGVALTNRCRVSELSFAAASAAHRQLCIAYRDGRVRAAAALALLVFEQDFFRRTSVNSRGPSVPELIQAIQTEPLSPRVRAIVSALSMSSRTRRDLQLTPAGHV